jgi:hypothetical protein
MGDEAPRRQIRWDSMTGRHLFQHLRQLGASILAAGASDWVVHAGPSGYPDDEAYFLRHILHTVDEELKPRAELDRAEPSTSHISSISPAARDDDAAPLPAST